MNFYLVSLLDLARHQVGIPFHVTAGFATTGHSKNSMHYQGKAVDFIAVLNGKKPMDVWLDLLRFPFTGIGIYPHWKLNNKKEEACVGFHVDVRDVGTMPPGIIQSRWIGICDNSEQKYVAVNEHNLIRYGIIKKWGN